LFDRITFRILTEASQRGARPSPINLLQDFRNLATNEVKAYMTIGRAA
jgi:hypothetical protein